ncbi:oligosaccharide flippase family protein [Rhodococcus pseudokoreensis]|uniref:Oligosaccharide flippase family protein n=1 Tax=Rhodococcus pseudokoreensis TaxID=2811421 RepID=A0A974W2I1_9NOCA|nr:oligosaccharide flippase family protein [Rhodococcus pseudokoreensis]QSE89764.1 oligosaccharide flippase family protein [Rhodococcus pseudokoreensis]
MTAAARLRTLVVADSPVQLVVGNLGAAALSLLSAPIVARAIGPDGRGETAAAIALFFIVPIVLAFGIPLEVRRVAATTDGKAVLRSARVFCALSVLLSVPVAVVAALTLFADLEDSARVVAAVGLAVSPLAMSWMCDSSVLIAHLRYRAVLVVRLTYPAIYVSLVSVWWILGLATTATVLAANVAGTVGTFAVALTLTKTSVRGEYHPLGSLRRGAVRYAGSAVAESASSRLDQVLALPLLGAAQAGMYSVAVTVAAVPLALGQALGASFFPLVARTEGAERAKLKAEAARVGVALALLSTPVLAAASYVGIPIVFGDAFEPAVRAAVVGTIGGGAMLAAYVCSMALAAEGRGVRMTIAQIVALATGIGLLFVLGPPFGAVGAAAASSVSYLLLLAILLVSLNVPLGNLRLRTSDFTESVARLLRRA